MTDKDKDSKGTFSKGLAVNTSWAFATQAIKILLFSLSYPFLFSSPFFSVFLFHAPQSSDYLQHNYCDLSVSLLSFCPAHCHLSSSLRSYF